MSIFTDALEKENDELKAKLDEAVKTLESIHSELYCRMSETIGTLDNKFKRLRADIEGTLKKIRGEK